MRIKNIPLFLLVVFLSMKTLHSSVKFTNLRCKAVDSAFCAFPTCSLKAYNRSTNLLTIRAKFFQVPITNISLTLDIRKRASGYRPFLYNVTFDACRFFRERNKFRVVNFMFNMIADYTNANHTCPFEEDLAIENYPSHTLDRFLIEALPFPKGEYALYSTWSAYNVPRAFIQFYVSLT